MTTPSPVDGGAASQVVTARKYGKRGTRYASTLNKCSFTFWPCGRGYASILLRDGLPAKRSYHSNRGDAVFAAGEWVDPSQNERYILDNDHTARRAVAA